MEAALPNNFIVGGGFFVRHSLLPLSLAWEVFGKNNGAASKTDFKRDIGRYASDEASDPFIGCIALTQPFYLPREQWIPVPPSWASNIVQGKGYNTEEEDGKALWEQLQDVLLSPT